MKKSGFTLAQHDALGSHLKSARNSFVQGYVDLVNAYPAKTEAVIGLKKALDALDEARNKLDDLVCKEHHLNTDEAIFCYYGQRGITE